MTLSPGHRLGPYEVLSALGVGGMGEVYLARDTRLGRTVAVKVLRARSTGDVEDRRRLLHEARAISSLNHPNICTLHDVGSDDGIDYLVMEFLEGETLSARIARGPIPREEAIRIAIQIAGALEAAHRRSLIHHDLKPANIMLTQAGAKLLDFGIAGLRPSGPVASEAPTLTGMDSPDTRLPCTIPYAAPEVISGRTTDARSDLWAFGATLYEMMTGRRAFDKGSVQATLAAILDLEPEPLAPESGLDLDRVVRQCLAKDPDDRWQTAGDLRRELQWIANHPIVPPEARPGDRRRWGWVAAMVVVIAAAGVAGFLRPRVAQPELMRFRISAPAGGSISTIASDMAVSPDGREVVFVGSDARGRSGLWVRRLSELVPFYLSGTDDAIYPFWSPDSRQIAFFADGKLKRVAALGGEVTTLSEAPDARGGTWGRRGVIVFAPSLNTTLRQVAAEGGPTRPAIVGDSTERGDQRYPCFLPDGRHFLYSTGGRAMVGALDSPDRSFASKVSRAAIYAPPGYLLFARDGYLVAQAFDPGRNRVHGEPIRLNEFDSASRNTGDRTASVSETGLLVYPTTGADRSEFYWVDAAGKEFGNLPLPAESILSWRLSPDGRRVAMTAGSPSRGISIWVYDLASSTAVRLTFGSARDRSPIWSPDSKLIVYESDRNGTNGLYVRRADPSGTDSLVFTSDRWLEPYGWSVNGVLALGRIDPVTGYDVWLVPIQGDRIPVPFLRSPASEKAPAVSPDGKWLAYESNESGRFEIYVRALSGPSEKYQVSTSGGRRPDWSRDGRELFYFVRTDFQVAVAIEGKGMLRIGAPGPLGRTGPASNSVDFPDGPRFLRLRAVGAEASGSLTVVQNWMAILRSSHAGT